MTVHLTHPERVLYADAAITKADLAAYLEQVAPVMLPNLARRIVSLVRCPEGAAKACFFQKHASAGMPDALRTTPVTEKDGEAEDYLFIDSADGLVAAAQIGTLEFHIWGSHVETIEQPDRVVFDLDPDPSVAFGAVKQAAIDIHDALQALGLESFPLLTGGKGIHVVVPIEPEAEWPRIKAFAGTLARRFAEDEPERFVATMSKAQRTGKIFIDHFRNERGSTAIAPLSPRARPGAPLAWPVDWDALPDFDAANTVTIGNVGEHDPGANWQRYFGLRQRLSDAVFESLGVEA